MRVVSWLIPLMLLGCGSQGEAESESDAESECPVATGGPCGDVTCGEESLCLIEFGCKGTNYSCWTVPAACVDGCPSCDCFHEEWSLCPVGCTEQPDGLSCPDC